MNTDAPRRGASGPAEEYARGRAVAAGTPRAGVAEGCQGVPASGGCADAPDAPGAVQPVLYRWRWRARLPERRGQLFRVLARGKPNACLIRFEGDGALVVTSRDAPRRA